MGKKAWIWVGTALKNIGVWLGEAVRKKNEENKKKEPSWKHDTKTELKLTKRDKPRATLTVEKDKWDEGGGNGGGSGGGAGNGSDAAATDATAPGDLGALVLKVAGAIATGVGVASAVVVVGASIFWIRLEEVGLPASQAVNAIPKNELLVTGAQEVIIFMLLALVPVIWIALCDPKGVITRGTVIALIILVSGASAYAICTELGAGWVVFLAALAIVLALGSVRVAFATGERFWPLAVSVFLAALVFSATCGFLVVKYQRFVQPVAILRAKDDKGLTGVYVTATSDRIYFGQVKSSSLPTPQASRCPKIDVTGFAQPVQSGAHGALYEVKRTDTTTYAVGQLQSVAEASCQASRMLRQLQDNASGLPTPATPQASATPTTPTTPAPQGSTTTPAAGQP